MITGFEEITYELTEFEEKTILPIIKKGWESKEKEVIVKAREMISGVNEYCIKQGIKGKKDKPFKLDGPRLRKIIHYLRVSGTFPNLVATSKGYFLTDDEEKIKDFILSCRERANSFLEVAQKLEYYNFR